MRDAGDSAGPESVTEVTSKRVDDAADGIADTAGKSTADATDKTANGVYDAAEEVTDGFEQTAVQEAFSVDLLIGRRRIVTLGVI
jgi:hypothetical protein